MPVTPKRSANLDPTTPKSATRKRTREEIESAKAEKEKKRVERKEKADARKRQLEDEKRKRDEKREKEKAEREERKAKEIKEKEERQKARDEEKRLKDEEKARKLFEKEEQKRKKEEEKLKEEKLKEEQRLAEEAKKKKEENKFKSFFSGKKRVITTTKVQDCSKWSKFELKPNQIKAPISFNQLTNEEVNQLDLCLRSADSSCNYLAEVKRRKPRSRGPFERLHKDDVKLVNPELEVALKQVI